MFKKIILAVLLSLVSISANAFDKSHVLVGAGVFDFTDKNDESEGRIEYRHHKIWRELSPVAGVDFTDEGSLYGYGGILYDVNIGSNFHLVPNFAAGLYDRNDGKDLGGAIEFRSGIEIDYVFPCESRLGINLSHKSNAGIYKHNPGEESLIISVSVPLSR